MLNVAFVGSGRISDLHALGYARAAASGLEARIGGVYDLDPARAAEKAGQWGVDKIYRAYDEVLADPAVDLVEILVPHHLHCEMAVAAAQAGKNVSVQKPMALTLQEADRMIGAASAAGVVLRVFENFVFYPPYVKARELVAAGEIGEPVSFNLRVRTGLGRRAWPIPGDAWAWRFDPSTCGGGPIMFDHGYHNFSLAVYMLGRPDKVWAHIGATEVFPGSGLLLDSPAAVWWTYGTGPAFGLMDVAHAPELAIDTEHYADEARLEVTGTKGIVFVNRMTGRLQNRAPVELYRDGVTTCFEHIPAGWEESFVASTLDLVEALAAGREPHLSGARGRDVLAFTLAAHEAARQGRTVTIDYGG